jgi:ribonuclease VapC
MIAVDASAVMAILLGEPQSDGCMAALEVETDVVMSVVTLAECFVVGRRRNVADEMVSVIDGLSIDIVSVTRATAQRVARVCQRWGKGYQAPAVNLGDCFAYDVAQDYGCGLPFVGDDFSRTDVQGVL